MYWLCVSCPAVSDFVWPCVFGVCPCVTTWTQAHQALLSMEFSRQEYWSGMSFPSPGDLPDPGIEPRSPALQADSLPAEPQGKPRSTGVGSLSLLQQTFLTQESNHSLLHCRRILYQLSYKGNLDSVLKSRDITLPTKFWLVKAMSCTDVRAGL